MTGVTAGSAAGGTVPALRDRGDRLSADPPSSQPPPPTGPPNPWPGPPSTWPGEPGGQGGWGEPPRPAGPPPPPWQRRRRRWLIGLSVAGALLIIGVPVAFGIAAVLRAADDISLTTGDAGDGSDDPSAEQAPGGEDVEVVPPDLDELDGTDEVLARVLIDIDRAEREMMAAQATFRDVLSDPGAADDPETALADVSDAAGEGQRALQEIRRDLTTPVEGSEGVRSIRDRYLAHLDAWVRYLVAVEQDPAVLTGGVDTDAYSLAIDTTGDAFAREVRESLPEGTDERVRAFALQIVERGFAGGGTPDGDTV